MATSETARSVTPYILRQGASIACVALSLYTLRFVLSPVPLQRRGYVGAFATLGLALEMVVDPYHTSGIRSYFRWGRDHAEGNWEEDRNVKDIRQFLEVWGTRNDRKANGNRVLEVENVKAYDTFSGKVMDDTSISRKIYYYTASIWSSRANRAVLHGSLLKQFEEAGVSESDRALATLQLANLENESQWITVTETSKLTLAGSALIQMITDAKRLLPFSSAVMATSMISIAICCARQCHLYYTPSMLENKERVAGVLRSILPEAFEKSKDESGIERRQNAS